MHGKAARGAQTDAAAEGMKTGREQKRTKAMKVLLAQNFELPALHLHLARRNAKSRGRSRDKGIAQDLDLRM
jgi:hypothetical protein